MARGPTFLGVLGAIARESARAQRRQIADQRAAARFSVHQEREAERRTRSVARAEKERLREEKLRYLEDRQQDVDDKNAALEERLRELDSVLADTLVVNDKISFSSLRLSDGFKQYALPVQLSSDPSPPQRFEILPPGFFGRLIPWAAKRHEGQVIEAERLYEAALADHSKAVAELAALRKQHKEAYEKERAAFLAHVKQRNASVDELEKEYEQGDPTALVTYNQMVLERSEYPEGFPQKFRLAYVEASKDLVIEYELPTVECIPPVAEYRYVKSRDQVDEKPRKQNEIGSFYRDLVASVALRTLHEVFEADQHWWIQVATFSGYVSTVDKATGRDVRPCVLSLRVTRDNFTQVDLARVDRIACLRNLGASVSPRPDELIAVKPVVEFDMVDKRFVDQANVLDGIDGRSNLMELSPFEFEALVSNLFAKMGLESKLTRSSRDGGVDAVAFDSRPVLGGKVVIQAKRYKNTVGVSAVRDLYGTMMNEGANKGILVCTSGYGPDAFEFASDKPIELIDGGGLLYLLEQVGVKARIVLPDGEG
jgi:restriction system protein